MDPLTRDAIEAIMTHREHPCISIYLRTFRAGAEVRQNAARFRKLLRQAEEHLTAGGLRGPDARALLQPAQALVDDEAYWQHQQEGLAAFLCPSFFRHNRLHLPFDDRLLVSDRFHTRPLLPLLTGDGRFYILALGQQHLRLFRGTRHSIAPVGLRNTPTSVAALGFATPERQLQLHVGTQTGTGGIFHGHGSGADEGKENILRYFQEVNRGLHDILRDEHAPLVLAGVDYLLPIYRDVNSYPYLMAEGLTGSPEGLRPEDLHRDAWAIVERYFEQQEREAFASYRERVGTGLASRDIKEIVPAAYHGRVDRLFVPLDAAQWGRFDPETSQVHVHDRPEPGDEDLVDLAAIHTVLKRGAVFAVERTRVPDEGPVAAVFRY